jgi:hypothetical protein
MAGESRDDVAGAAAGGDSAPVAGGVATRDELPASLQILHLIPTVRAALDKASIPTRSDRSISGGVERGDCPITGSSR